MDIQCIDQIVNLLQKALELARELYRALQEGLPLFSLLPEKAAIDLTTVHRKPAEAKAGPVTCYATVTECNATVTPGSAETVTGNAAARECTAAAKKEKENEKRKNQRKEIKKNKKTKDDTSIGPAKETGERNAAETTATPEAKPDNGNNPPAAEQPPTKSNKIIPTAKLPEAYRNVIEAWNQLPLKTKLKGLYPLVIKQLGYLFEHYGEETVHKAIDRVRESQFLLGQSKNSTGWVVSLTWLASTQNGPRATAPGCSSRVMKPRPLGTAFTERWCTDHGRLHKRRRASLRRLPQAQIRAAKAVGQRAVLSHSLRLPGRRKPEAGRRTA